MTTLQNITTIGSDAGLIAYDVGSSDPSVVTATATSSATVGSHSLLVTQLAQTDMVLTSTVNASGTSIADTEGAGTKTIQVTVNGVTTNVNVDIAAGDSNSTVLSNLAKAINSADSSVSASVLSVNGTDDRLVINGKSTGSQGAISLGDVSGTLLSTLGLGAGVVSARTASTSTTGGFSHTDVSALNAEFQFDGIDFVKDSNTISNIIPGLSIQLTGTQSATDTPVSLTVGLDKSNIQSVLQSFISQYNDVLSTVVSKTSVDPTTHVRQIFAGDVSFLNLRMQLQSIMGGSVSSVATGNPSTLSQIGISIASDGSLSISDPSTLTAVAGTDGSPLTDLFTSAKGFATQLQTLVNGFTNITGILASDTQSTNDQLSSLSDRITQQNTIINAKAAHYQDELARLQAEYTYLTEQQQMITDIVDSVTGTTSS